jgi:hypothetical protein
VSEIIVLSSDASSSRRSARDSLASRGVARRGMARPGVVSFPDRGAPIEATSACGDGEKLYRTVRTQRGNHGVFIGLQSTIPLGSASELRSPYNPVTYCKHLLFLLLGRSTWW